ncbi:hypothetical protein AGMMS50256_39590 [Betaproteobacteria bacterium]|nr:hypothetical protein AGMMS50256_39590 [Betaproteobacteria bacterium]
MGFGISLVSGLTIPFDGFCLILPYALSVGVHLSELELRFRIFLIGGIFEFLNIIITNDRLIVRRIIDRWYLGISYFRL